MKKRKLSKKLRRELIARIGKDCANACLREGVDYEFDRKAGVIRFIGKYSGKIKVHADFSILSPEDLQLLKKEMNQERRDAEKSDSIVAP